MDRLIRILVSYRKPIVGALLALLTVAAAFNVFTGLGSERVRSWDEARHGVSVCEMMTTGNYIVNTYNFETDYWNVKPVLSFYNNLIGIKLFGKNIFGLRAVSAFSYLIIAALTFLLLYREAGIGAALVGMAAFIVSPTNWLHSFRTGDPDALFMLFCFASFVLMWISLRRSRMLYPAAFFLGLAFLTKSFHVGVPGLMALIFVAFNRKKYSWYDLVLAAVIGAAPVLLWAALRFHADGLTFFQNMVERDLLGRIQGGGELCEHRGSPWYDHLLTLNHYLIVIPLAMIAASIAIGMFFRGKKCFSASAYDLGKWAGFFFLFALTAFSCCSVKLAWYILPSLLYIPVIFGMIFAFACRWLAEEYRNKRGMLFFLPPLAIITACVVWIFIGEGKAIRNVVKIDRQQDVLTADNGGDGYRNGTFYCVDPDGKPYLPRQKFMLILRFLEGEVVLKSVDEYKKDPKDALLVCTFDDIRDEKVLRRLAENVASKHSLRLIRCVNCQGLYSR